RCRMPGLPLSYHGHLEGQAAVIDAQGNVIASRSYQQGPGVVVADVCLQALTPPDPLPEHIWLRSRGVVPALSWHLHGMLGRRWYRHNILRAR
ncbi:MAG: carbon-nitrogen hydrolase family protein, partial [Gammaproteobacteria bacterium]|nr:carbon-nitrogen hydrolase family protein [Gammaproteobacteria bacterium]